MQHPLEDELTLRLLRYLVSGQGVKINIKAVATDLNIHRSTAKKKINWLYENNLINPPFYPFPHLYDEYPLLVLVKADIPRTKEVREFIMDDSHIFAAFSCMEGPYNTLLMEFFRDLESYHSWREQIVIDQKIPTREHRSPADAYILSNKLTFKYDPNCFVSELQKRFSEKGTVVLNDQELDKTTFPLLINLMNGKYIQRNDSAISRELGINRKTIKHRIELLQKEHIIGTPKCFFPNLFVPPGYNLVVSMIELRGNTDKIKQFITAHPNISRAQETSTGWYNMLIFSAFQTIEGFFDLGGELMNTFPHDIGAISNTIFSAKMIHTIKPQKLSLAWIERQLWEIATNRHN